MSDNDRRVDVFIYLIQHVSSTTQLCYESLLQLKQNILTIMSFCLIGILTFIATANNSLEANPLAKILVLLSLSLWGVAFACTLLRNPGKHYYALPGQDEKLTFLPTKTEKARYKKSRVSADYADVYFASAYLQRFNKLPEELEIQCDEEDRQIVDLFNEAIRDNDDLSNFNQNAWLASLVHIHIGHQKHYIKVRHFYFFVQTLFVLSVICTLIAAWICYGGSGLFIP